MKISTLAPCAAVLSLFASISAAQQPVEGVHFERVKTPYGAEDHQIVNVFSPACRRCYRLEDRLTAWAEENDLSIKRVPDFQEDRWVEVRRLVIAIQKTFDETEEIIQLLYSAIHNDNVEVDNINRLVSYLPITDADAESLLNLYSSRSVRNIENEIRDWTEENLMREVPAIVINDRYYSDPARARGNDNLLLLLDYLTAIR